MLRIDLSPLLCYNTLKGGDIMKKRFLMIGSILVAIVCVLLILWKVFCFLLINSNGIRSIVINDSNRQKIEQLISQNIEDGILLNVDNATNVEWQSLMHKDQIVVNYDDEDDFVFYITNRYENSLIEYIKSNGDLVYFESGDFIADMVKTFLYVILLTFAIIVFIKQKIKNN